MEVAKGRNRIEKRVVDMSAVEPEEEPTPAWTPNLEECTEDAYPIVLTKDDRLFVRMNCDPQGRVVEFALMQQTRTAAGSWTDIVRVDTAHGEVHRHRFDRAGGETRESLVAITGPHDVMNGYDSAYEALLSDWEANVERWRDGR